MRRNVLFLLSLRQSFFYYNILCIVIALTSRYLVFDTAAMLFVSVTVATLRPFESYERVTSRFSVRTPPSPCLTPAASRIFRGLESRMTSRFFNANPQA
jgi:hypothetical protein